MPMVPFTFVPAIPETEKPHAAQISKAVAACNSEYASSEGQADAAAYQTRWHRFRLGQDRPR